VQRSLGDEAERVGLEAAVGFGTGLVLLAVVSVIATVYAGKRLQTLRLNDET
jgi:ABC-2 type transport system permease protein